VHGARLATDELSKTAEKAGTRPKVPSRTIKDDKLHARPSRVLAPECPLLLLYATGARTACSVIALGAQPCEHAHAGNGDWRHAG